MFGSRFKKSKSDAVTGFLGSQTEFTGKLSFSGVVHLDGVFNGEIVSRGTLVLGSESVIRARIHANIVKIAGEVHGDVAATEKIELYPPGKVYGSLLTPRLLVEEGAFFEGSCKMTVVEESLPDLTDPSETVEEEEEALEAISAEAWPISYDRVDEMEGEEREDSTIPKAGQ